MEIFDFRWVVGFLSFFLFSLTQSFCGWCDRIQIGQLESLNFRWHWTWRITLYSLERTTLSGVSVEVYRLEVVVKFRSECMLLL